MQSLGTVIIKEFIYNSEEERNTHVTKMAKDGWEDSGKVQKDINQSFNNPNWKPYAKLFKYED